VRGRTVGSLLALAALSAAPGKQTFTGVISDDMCAKGDHSEMRMGPTDAECVAACVSTHDAVYVLYDGKAVYTLTDQRTAERFAAQKVAITGVLDRKTNTIQVASIRAAR
jgi:phage gp37-like protein